MQPTRLVVFKADSVPAKRNRLDSAHRLAEHRSSVEPSADVKKLGASVSVTCSAVMTHVRRHLDMADITRTNIVVTEVGDKTYQMQTKGLHQVSVRRSRLVLTTRFPTPSTSGPRSRCSTRTSATGATGTRSESA